MTTTIRVPKAAVASGRVWLSGGPGVTGGGQPGGHTTPAVPGDLPDSGQTSPDTQAVRAAVGEPTGAGQLTSDITAVPGLLADPLLAMLAATVDDAEDAREKAEAHLRELRDPNLHDRASTDPDVITYTKVVEGAQAYEDSVIKVLKKAMAQHPLAPWMTSTPGVGAKQLARLLGAIGDPYWHSRDDRPRLVSELWAYCGFHVLRPDDHSRSDTHTTAVAGVAPKRQRGVQGNWNETARMRCRLIAESCLKVRTSPYQAVYYEARKKYAEAVHVHPCAQCGSKGKPAQPGTPLRLGHQHGRALRAVAKAFLKDLWREAERLHSQQAAIHATTPKAAAPPAQNSNNGQATSATDPTEQYVKKVLAAAPPLTPEQRDRIGAILGH